MPRSPFSLLSLLAVIALTPFAAHSRPEVIQEVDGLANPAAAVYSPDGKQLFVVNRVRGEIGVMRSKSFITKYKVEEDGTVKLASLQFLPKLTAPADIAFSPVRLGRAPAGSGFLITGTPLIENEIGRMTKDASGDFIGLIVFDRNTGEIYHKVDLGPASKTLLKGEYPLISPSSVAFDKEGNLFIGDTGIGGHLFQNRYQGGSVIYRIEKKSVNELLRDEVPQEVQAMRISSLPGDMCYSTSDNILYFISNHNQGAPTGQVFMLAGGEFKGSAALQTIVRGLESLNGLQVTPNGRVLLVSNGGELMFPKGKKDSRAIRFRPHFTFATAGKIDTISLADGSLIVAVPEESSDAGPGKGQIMKIVKLPSGY